MLGVIKDDSSQDPIFNDTNLKLTSMFVDL